MKYRWLVVLLIFGAIGATVWLALPQGQATTAKVGLPPSGFVLPDLQGELHGMPAGEVVLLNFWATWCPPCRQEIPSMIELHEKYKAQGLKIVAVSVDQRREDLASFVREYQMPFQVLHDADASVSHQLGVFRYPETFLIDQQGKIRFHHIGAVDWMSAPVLDTVESILNESTSGVAGGESQPGNS